MSHTRADDEQVLAILRLRRQGLSQREIAANVGLTRNEVRSRIQQAREQDCKHDPTAHKYWRYEP